MAKNKVEGLFTLDEMYLTHAALRHLGNSIDHLMGNILERTDEPPIELMDRLENLAAKIERIISQLETGIDVFN